MNNNIIFLFWADKLWKKNVPSAVTEEPYTMYTMWVMLFGQVMALGAPGMISRVYQYLLTFLFRFAEWEIWTKSFTFNI